MNTRALNALAGVICAAQKQGRQTPIGIAQAIAEAQMLQSPETAAELIDLRAEVERLERERDGLRDAHQRGIECLAARTEDLLAAEARIDELVEQRDGALVDLASVPDTYVDCRVCGAGRLAGKPCGICEFNARMTAEAGEPV